MTGENTSVTGADYQWFDDPVDDVDNGEGFVFSNSDFRNAKGTLETLTKAFCYCWERPAYETNHLVSTRIPSAIEFYNTFGPGGSYPPYPGIPHKRKNKFNFILFNRHRRWS